MTPTEFTPLTGLAGGALIGLSAVVLMLTAGRIAGASSIFRGLLTLNFNEDFGWRVLFMIGLMIGAAVSGLLFFDPNTIKFPSATPMTIISGLIVGVGVTLGNGCTSGHGICGLSRFSKRSLAATCIFMVVAVTTVFVTRHVMGG